MAGTLYVKRQRAIKTLFRPQIREDRQMATWSKDELHKIAEADDLPIAPFRENGVTYGTPTWIWSVAGRSLCAPGTTWSSVMRAAAKNWTASRATPAATRGLAGRRSLRQSDRRLLAADERGRHQAGHRPHVVGCRGVGQEGSKGRRRLRIQHVPSEVLFHLFDAKRRTRPRPSLVYCGDDQDARSTMLPAFTRATSRS
jgi:hypothetical protein